jgi:thiamine-monophosphate kinase
MKEGEIVARLRELFPRIGDDAAVVGGQVITTDMLIEDVDFTRTIDARFIARKSLAVNLSDLAAMGATPLHAVVSLGVPEWLDILRFFEALKEAADEWQIEIVGGDLSKADKLIISVTAVGEAAQPLMRSGAKPGDRLYVSRPIGGSAAGLQFLQKPPAASLFMQREVVESAIRRHVDPEPELELGRRLVGVATSCIDISDGLSTDLHHLCDASQVGAAVERARIPVFPGLAEARLGIDVRKAVLHGGEEYALLFTSPLREAELSAKVRRPVYGIGRITRERDVLLDGEPLEAGGWDHFASAQAE